MENKMKKTGISYIPYVSADWDVKRIRHLTSFVYRGVAPDYTDDTTRPMVVNQATFSQAKWDISKVRYTKTKLHGCRGRLKKGDVLLASTGGGVLGKTFFFEENEDNYIADSHVTILRPNRYLDAKFIYYFFSISYDMINDLLAKGSTNQTELQRNLLRMLEVPAPKKEEQERIVLFLDKEIPQIENVLDTLRNEVEVLSAAKRSLITECITQGINNEVSFIECDNSIIKRIPQKWKYIKVKYVANFYNGDRSEKYPKDYEIVDEGIAFLNSENIHGEVVDTSQKCKYITKEKYSELGGAKLKINDIIFCLRGSIGLCAINKTEEKGTIASSLVAIRAKDCILPDFLNYYLSSEIVKTQTIQCMNGSCAANLSADDVKNYFIAMPNSLDEQQEIVDYLDKKCGAIDRIIEVKTKQIENLETHKMSMIYDYVTGAKRVGGTA